MTGKSTKSASRSGTFEGIAAVALGVLAIGAFALQVYSFDSKTTQRETVLFNTLQFLLTLGFGWFSTRAVSRAEFERNLKQFAIGAYRRITDIEAMVDRLRSRLHQGQTNAESSTNLEVVSCVLEDTLQVVRSSTADWADVIGDELLALQTIQSLRQEKTELKFVPALEESIRSTDQRIQEIDTKIERLTNRLPPNLQIESRRADFDERLLAHQVDWMRDRHLEEDGLRLSVVAGGQWRSDGDVTKLDSGSELYAVLDSTGANVENADGVILGRILNNSPLDYAAFKTTLSECFGKPKIAVHFVTLVGKRQDKDALV